MGLYCQRAGNAFDKVIDDQTALPDAHASQTFFDKYTKMG